MSFDEKENDILIHWALRFDGYKYREDTGMDENQIFDGFFCTGEWPDSQLDQLSSFFLLQRFLMKWGGEYEPPNGKYWCAFRNLFLITSQYTIPERYQNGEYYLIWKREYLPKQKDQVAYIASIHESTSYDDNAPL